VRWLAAVTLALLLVAACGSHSDDASTDAPDQKLRIAAASSLTEAFTELARAFEADHPDIDVQLSFAASSALVEQVRQGAPADVVATADDATLRGLVEEGLVAIPTVIARNRLSLIVEPGNPKNINGLADLARGDVVFVLCATPVPCGKVGALALQRAGVTRAPASLEDNVKGVVAKVTLGEADAGIVYVSDVTGAGDKAAGVAIAGADDPALQAAYPMAVAVDTKSRSAAEAWMTFVRSADGQRTLARFGFLRP
jgi:molybdate transport system substrate-binding protein